MKKVRWITFSFFVATLTLFAAIQIGWLCPDPRHWVDTVLCRSHRYVPEPADFIGGVPQPKEPKDLIDGQPDTCEIHHGEMRIEIVPVHYGTPSSLFRDENGHRILAPGEIDPDIRKSLFPHAAHWEWGGCGASIEYKTARIRICTECERAEQSWRAEHPENK